MLRQNLRYVDDIFNIFEEEKSSSKFLEVLNHQHKNLEFTMEKSIGAFPFLDVQININENILETRIWRKPTHTGVILNFSAACPEQWKTGLIICLIKRAKTICSDKFDVLRGRLLGNHNDFHWQLGLSSSAKSLVQLGNNFVREAEGCR